MRKSVIYTISGVFLFGSFYNSGALTQWFGIPDGRDHAAVIAMQSTTAVIGGDVMVQNMITGSDFLVPGPERPNIAAMSTTAVSSDTILPPRWT